MTVVLPDVATLGDLAGKRVYLRCDLNVPLDPPAGAVADAGRIRDDGRIRASLPQISQLLDAGTRLAIGAHLGRPKGQDEALSLAPVATRLAELLDRDVRLVGSPTGDPGDADVAVLENVRFDPRETSKVETERQAMAGELASHADAYVCDAFGAVHRAHASVVDLPALLPHAAGELVRREVEVLDRLVNDPSRPYVVVLGGSKVSDKLAVIEHLLPAVDKLCVGGGMCFTFLAAQGHDVGRSLLESDQLDACRALLDTGKIVLPTDVVVAAEIEASAATKVVPADAIPADLIGLDIGPDSVDGFAGAIREAATVFWNGPMGVFELAPFAAGTRAVAQAIADLSAPALTVVGGGDSAAAIRALGIDEALFGHVSTGGGASLEYLEGRTLPGLAALER